MRAIVLVLFLIVKAHTALGMNSEEECYLIRSYVDGHYKIGETIALRTIHGKYYIGTYEGTNADAVFLKDRHGNDVILFFNKLAVDNVPFGYTPETEFTPVIRLENKPSLPAELLTGLSQKKSALVTKLWDIVVRSENAPAEDFGQVPAYGMFQIFHSEMIWAINDPAIDPILHRWLAEVRNKIQGIYWYSSWASSHL